MTNIIQTRGLTKEYGGIRVAESIDLHLPEGKIYGLLGRNGAGKTTLMKMILRLVHPTSGTIELFGQDHWEEPGALHRIESMIETPGFYGNLTAWENLTLIGKLRGIHKKEPLKEALELVGLQDQTRKPFSDYSLGMKQRLGIAAAILPIPVRREGLLTAKFAILLIWVLLLTLVTWGGVLVLCSVYHHFFDLEGYSLLVAGERPYPTKTWGLSIPGRELFFWPAEN